MSTPRPSRATALAGEEVLGKAYDVHLMRRLWQFVRLHKRLLVIGLALIPAAVGFELVQPYLLKLAIEDYIGEGDLAGLDGLALLYVACVLGQGVMSYAQLYALQLLGQRSMHDLRLAIYSHVLGQRSAFFDRMPVGRLMTRMTNDIESINEMFASGVITLIADLVKLVGIVVIMFWLNARLTLMTFLTLPLLVLVIDYARRLMRRSFREIRVKLAAMNSYLSEHLSGIKVVQLFARERAALAEYNELNLGFRNGYFEAIRADAVMYAMVEAIGYVSVACIAWYAGASLSDALSVGLVVAFIEYINKFFIPIRDFSAKYAVMQSAMASTERIVQLLDTDEPDAPMRAAPATSRAHSTEPRADDARPAALPPATSAALAAATADARQVAAIATAPPMVSFAHVTFGYRADEPVLRDVSFAIPAGQHVAVVGATGSGKSTLIKLLARLYEHDDGDICLRGRDVRQLPIAELRRRLTVVSQDVFLFAGTVADNVRLGRPEASDAAIAEALARVGADRMLARRGATLDEPVAERGGNFSAGERQLIAFARALVRDPDVLVLDEATAHVDPEAESWIERGVAELMKDRTTLVIAHRLSTIRNADQILVMARGRIIERGTHDALVAAGGVYAALERTFSRHSAST